MPGVERISPSRVVPRFIHVFDVDAADRLRPGLGMALLGAKLPQSLGGVRGREVFSQLRELRRQPFLGGDYPRIAPHGLRQLEVGVEIVVWTRSRFGRSCERVLQRKEIVVIPKPKA